MKYLFLAVSSFLAVVAQMIAGNNFILFNFLDPAIILIAYCAVYRSRVQALYVGSLIGLLLDATLGWPLGYNGFGRTLAALVIGQSWKRFNTSEQPMVRFLILFVASCASSASMYALMQVMERTTSRIFPGSALLQALITATVGFAFFAVMEGYKRAQANKAQM
ncbi:MAG: rod shape-determining protein MreD [Acidobacteriota bacterium]|jgi:rod shape-determining protein MreD|nr:rod shape-determining protein MreD [Acidobacteriota bacterium]